MLDFPASPTLNQQFTSGASTWLWDGVAWNIIPQMTPATASDTPPPNPAIGQLWWRASNGQMYIWYDDGNTRQWVQTSTAVAPVPGAWELIGEYLLSGVPKLDIPNLGAFRRLRLQGTYTPLGAAGSLLYRTSTDNGTSFDAGATDYSNQVLTANAAASSAAAAAAATGSIASVGYDANVAVIIDAAFDVFNQASQSRAFSRSFGTAGGGTFLVQYGSMRASAVARNALRLMVGTAATMNISITVEGVRG